MFLSPPSLLLLLLTPADINDDTLTRAWKVTGKTLMPNFL
jgi:hypothetical protein